MVTSTLEFTYSVCLNPTWKTKTALQVFLSHFDRSCTSNLAQIWRSFMSLELQIPRSHPLMESQISLAALSNSVISIWHWLYCTYRHFSTSFKWITAGDFLDCLSKSINATKCEIPYSGKSDKACIELKFI